MSPITLSGLALVAGLAATDTVPPSDSALDALIDRARAAARRGPTNVEAYRARTETEIALLVHAPAALPGAVAGTTVGTVESAAIVEQLAAGLEWERDGSVRQHVDGYRAQTAAFSVSALSIVRHAVVIPVLHGDRWWMFFAAESLGTTTPRRRPPMPVANPFAGDGRDFYVLSGGDTVATLVVDGRRVPLARIAVQPRPDTPAGMFFLDGEAFVDASRGDLVRVRGRLVGRRATVDSLGNPIAAAPRSPGVVARFARGVSSVLDAATSLQNVAFVELENREVEGRAWLPYRQRVELQVTTSLGDGRAVVRTISRIDDVEVRYRSAPGESAVATSLDAVGIPSAPAPLSFAPRDSLGAFSAWRTEIGRATAETRATEFDDIAPARLRSTGRPVLRPQLRSPGELVRYNKVEGLWLGYGAQWRARDAAPGLMVRGNAGVAFSEEAVRGGVEASWDRGERLWIARASRDLASTNDFVPAFGGGSGGFFGVDDADYVDRWSVQAGITQRLNPRGGAVLRLETGPARDAERRNAVTRGPFGGAPFRDNRPATAGAYWRSLIAIDAGRGVLGDGAQSGVGVSLAAEHGAGNSATSFARTDVRLVARRVRGPVVLLARMSGATLLGPSAPPQRLVEVGGPLSLPGTDFKAFTGSRGGVGRLATWVALPVFAQPLRIGRLTLPALAPAPTLGMSAGWVEAPGAWRDRLAPFGWSPSDGVRATLDVGLRFFGGGVRIGAARPIDGTGSAWRAVISFGGDS
jgi:hypothetical protein